MYLDKVILTNFKNYSAADFQFARDFNIITGNNGQGKTNLLDAIYLLCMTKSYFQYSEKNLIKFDKDFFRVDGNFHLNDEIINVVCKYKLPNNKSFIVNDKEVRKFSHFIGKLPAVMIAPGDIQLIEEGSEERRKFIDISICQGNREYLEALNKYNKILKQRNSLLKQINRDGRSQQELIDYYNEEMAIISEFVMNSRRIFTDEINIIYNEIYEQIASGKEDVNCLYLPDCQGQKADFLEAYRASYKKDLILERTTRGIHKDDLEFIISSLPVKRIGSQGQIKSTIFAAKLAQYHWLKKIIGTKPILLLDDIFDKLDHHRVTNLLKIIDSDEYGQVFITDTYSERVNNILPELKKKSNSFTINEGKVAAHGK